MTESWYFAGIYFSPKFEALLFQKKEQAAASFRPTASSQGRDGRHPGSPESSWGKTWVSSVRHFLRIRSG